MEEYTLRYSNPFLYYTIFIGGATLFCSIPFLFYGYDWSNFPVNEYPLIRKFLGLFLILFACCLAAIIYLIPLFTALKITDKKALVTFSDHCVKIKKEEKTIIIDYDTISKIKFVNVTSSGKGYVFLAHDHIYWYTGHTVDHRRGHNRGPYLYRVVIYNTMNKKYKFYMSYNESWQCRRYKTYPTVYGFAKKLEEYSGCKVDFTNSIWG